jgi:hypothetical protein
VSALARRRLACVWDAVVEVPALRFECRKLVSVKQRRMYEQWVETSFTKWNCLALTQYAKVVFIDADKVVLANCDELFALRAPAGTFSSPWAWPFNTKGEGIPNPYALSCAQHGDAVPAEAIRAALDGGSFVVVGTMLLLEPCARTHSDLLAYCARTQPIGRAGCVSMMDEQAITMFFVDERPDAPWTFIHQRYNYISWHRSWLDDDDQPKVRQRGRFSRKSIARDFRLAGSELVCSLVWSNISLCFLGQVFHYFGSKVWNIPRTDFLGADVWWQFAVALCADNNDESEKVAALDGVGRAEIANGSSSIAQPQVGSTLPLVAVIASDLAVTECSPMRGDSLATLAHVDMIPESSDIATSSASPGDCTQSPASSSSLSLSSSSSSTSSLSDTLSRLHSLSRSALLRGAFDAALLALPRVAAAPVGCVWCESCGVDDTAHHLVDARAAISCPRLMPPPLPPPMPVIMPQVPVMPPPLSSHLMSNSCEAHSLNSSESVAVLQPVSLTHISASAVAPLEQSDSSGGEHGGDVHPNKRQRCEETSDAKDSAPQ